MFEAGGGFRFTTESLQMCFCGPMAQPDHFNRDGAIQTLLARAIHHTLTATADFLKQFVIAEVSRCLCLSCCLRTMRRGISLTRFDILSGVLTSGCERSREQTKANLKQAGGAKALRCVGKNFRPALSTNSECATHCGRVVRTLPILYCAELYHTLRSQHSDQMAQLIFDIAGNSNGVADFLSQQGLVTVAKSIEGLANCILRHT